MTLSIFGYYIEHFTVENNELACTAEIRPEFCYRYFPGVEADDGDIVLGYAADLENVPDHCALILIGRPSAHLLETHPVLYIAEGDERFFYEVQKAAGRLLGLAQSVQQILSREDPITELVNVASKIFGNHVFIHDSYYKLLAASEDPPGDNQWEYNEFQKCYILSEDIISEFKCNQDYLDTMDTHEASIFPAETFGYRILYLNLWDEQGTYQGRICVCELKRMMHPGDYWLIKWMDDVFRLITRPEITVGERLRLPIISMLEYLLNEGTVTREQMDHTLLNAGWTSRDRYYLVCLYPEQSDDLIKSENYQRQRLTELSPQFCILTHEGKFLLLVNETVDELSLSEFRYAYAASLRDLLMKVGISGVGQDLMEIVQLYRQACIAYEYGSRQASTFWVYFFDDYRMDYMLAMATGGFSTELICREDLYTLLEYDKEHTSELFHTLCVFLKWERSIARACEELEIHRTTLLYRMRRIGEITGLDLDDEKVRLDLILSYKFMEMKKYK